MIGYEIESKNCFWRLGVDLSKLSTLPPSGRSAHTDQSIHEILISAYYLGKLK